MPYEFVYFISHRKCLAKGNNLHAGMGIQYNERNIYSYLLHLLRAQGKYILELVQQTRTRNRWITIQSIIE